VDPDPQHWYLGLPDPQPVSLVRGTDPDPHPDLLPKCHGTGTLPDTLIFKLVLINLHDAGCEQYLRYYTILKARMSYMCIQNLQDL
jgi:hypothetical protein